MKLFIVAFAILLFVTKAIAGSAGLQIKKIELAHHEKNTRIERFEPAYHFTAMPICKPAGEAILKEENDDPVCTDPYGSNRADIHEAIVDIFIEELGL